MTADDSLVNGTFSLACISNFHCADEIPLSFSGNLIHKEMCSRTLNVNAKREHEQANAAQLGS